MKLSHLSEKSEGMSVQDIKEMLLQSLGERTLRKVLIIPPDFTRFHSNGGLITNLYYHELIGRGAAVDILPALGTHEPMSAAQFEKMYGDIPFERVLVHDWRHDVETIGEVPGQLISEWSGGLWDESISVEVNRLLRHGGYDLILSVGQVVPHEVVGMSNQAKNIFVGVGGADMINKSHMLGAVYGLEQMMGRDHTPVRKVFDYALVHYLADCPIEFVLTVTSAPGGQIHTHGLFIGDERGVLEDAISLSQQINLDYVDKPINKCVVYLDPEEFRTTWLGNKAVYRTRMAIADGGQLLILAPGVTRFGEDAGNDALIRKYGYCGRDSILKQYRLQPDLRENMGAAAHLIHGSSDGRFQITYAVKEISQEEIRSVGYQAADYDEMAARYDVHALHTGYNTLPDGEKIFFVPNPALGLWTRRGIG